MIKKIFIAIMLMVSGSVMAGSQNVIPTCFSDKLQPPKGVGVDTELFVVIDQTTLFDTSLKQSIANNIKPFLKAGNAISIVQFSAFTQGHYTDVLVYAKLDPDLAHDMRNDVSKPVLSKFDQCQSGQPRMAGQVVGRALKAAFGTSSNTIDKSDVLGSMKDISAKVRLSTANRRLVLLASDMLENSSVSSFYAKQATRQIDSVKELEIVKNNDLFGDFGDAEVYVIGAGLLAEDSKAPKGIYRSPQIMRALSTFWREWFAKSHAKVVDFGQPALLNPIQ